MRTDEAYSPQAIRAHLRRRGIAATIPVPADQVRHRRRGNRPPSIRSTTGAVTLWSGESPIWGVIGPWPPAMTSSPFAIRPSWRSPPSTNGSTNFETRPGSGWRNGPKARGLPGAPIWRQVAGSQDRNSTTGRRTSRASLWVSGRWGGEGASYQGLCEFQGVVTQCPPMLPTSLENVLSSHVQFNLVGEISLELGSVGRA